jgi:hypothetical protein
MQVDATQSHNDAMRYIILMKIATSQYNLVSEKIIVILVSEKNPVPHKAERDFYL